MNTNREHELIDIRRLGWVKGSACIGLIVLVITFSIASTIIAQNYLLPDFLQVLAFVFGALFLYVSYPLCLWTMCRWGLSLSPRESRTELAKKLINPVLWPVIILFLFMPGFIFFQLWHLLN